MKYKNQNMIDSEYDFVFNVLLPDFLLFLAGVAVVAAVLIG